MFSCQVRHSEVFIINIYRFFSSFKENEQASNVVSTYILNFSTKICLFVLRVKLLLKVLVRPKMVKLLFIFFFFVNSIVLVSALTFDHKL